ncbi:hypothetical protein [Ruania rhizosphaerae]|uniref:hypothetical protein n=1 Tax=Ruania rhizosphaerae TaxID=1840413 RepID=UPI00135AE4F2|nr:hypothetical protein [Ruania rhizosphaerae]
MTTTDVAREVNYEILYEWLDRPEQHTFIARAAVELLAERLQDDQLVKLLVHTMLIPEEARQGMDLEAIAEAWPT